MTAWAPFLKKDSVMIGRNRIRSSGKSSLSIKRKSTMEDLKSLTVGQVLERGAAQVPDKIA
jgi:hypothetical protein